jgi:hypothetical protein
MMMQSKSILDKFTLQLYDLYRTLKNYQHFTQKLSSFFDFSLYTLKK